MKRLRYFVSDLAYWVRTHPGSALRGLGLIVLAGVLIVGAISAIGGDEEEEPPPGSTPAPEVIVRTEVMPAETEELGYPAFATRNTTRIGGADSVTVAAGAALATFPSTGGLSGPPAVTLVPAADWPSAIAAGSLFAAPVSAPVLLTDGDEMPELVTSALEALAPEGSSRTGRAQAFVVGGAADPGDLRTTEVSGGNPAEIAAAIAELRAELTGDDPAHILIASSDEPAYAMPAAAWAARSGDPVLFAQRDSVPAATLAALERWEGVPVYILGPEEVISSNARREIRRASDGNVKRIEGEDPVANSIEFARFVDGDFGWNINDPGHGFVIASAERPADAGAAAALSASGSWGPLLVTDASESPPPALAGYLLDLKPGYENDPTRAVNNHIWIVGDEDAISVGFQAEVDELAEVAPVRSGTGSANPGPPPGTAEPEAQDE